MNKLNGLIIILAVILITAVSCQKKSNPPVGGPGGTASLVITPQHHYFAWPIDSCKVYIKYNTSNTPATYDDSAVCVCADSLVKCTFSNLKNGNYYIYGYGYDTSVHSNVAGGLPVTISTQNAATVINLPITEVYQ